MTYPLMETIAGMEPLGETFLNMPNGNVVLPLLPKRFGIRPITELTSGRDHKVWDINVQTLSAMVGHRRHPTAGYYETVGLPAPHEAIPPPIEWDEDPEMPEYDFAITTQSRANGSRMMPIETWKALLAQLSGRIVHLGSAEDPRPFDNPNVEYYHGEPLTKVACLMSKAKCLITLDNGIGRMAHAVQAFRPTNNHVLLCSHAVAPMWGSYPGAHLIWGDPKSWQVPQILQQVHSIVGATTSA